MSDDYRNRMFAISQELRAQGVGMYTSAPPIYRLAWLAGIKVRPPLYQSFRTLAIGTGVGFAVLFGLFLLIDPWRTNGRSVTADFVAAIFAGLFFGLGMAFTYQRKASKLRLSALDPPPSDK